MQGGPGVESMGAVGPRSEAVGATASVEAPDEPGPPGSPAAPSPPLST